MNRIFRADDGAELREEDVREVLASVTLAYAHRPGVERLRAALTPPRCKAVMRSPHGNPLGADVYGDHYRCNLLAGHEFAHQTAPETWADA